MIKKINMSPLNQVLFYSGLIIKLLAVFILMPELHSEYYLNFINNLTFNNFLDPWTHHIKVGGDIKDFPFGLVMYILAIPIFIFNELFSTFEIISSPLLLKLSFLVVDVLICLIFFRYFGQFSRNILILYWLSPLVFFITYWHGANDIFPVLFVTLSLILLNEQSYKKSAIFIALAISAKFSMIMIYPIVIVYVLLRNKFSLEIFYKYAAYSIGLFLALNSPILWSSGFFEMAYGASKSAEIFDLYIPFSSSTSLYVIPAAYLILLALFFRLKVVNFELLTTYLFISTFIIIHFINPSFGYYLWLVPYIVFFGLNANSTALILVMIFSTCVTFYHVLYSMGADFISFELKKSYLHTLNSQIISLNHDIKSYIFSLNTFLGIFLSAYFYEIGIKNNDFFKLKKNPLLLAISGDSGAGKDTLANSLQEVFNPLKTTHISGDDYHLWERGSENWKKFTHLNPEANNLEAFFKNSKKILNGKNIKSRLYDHSTGLFTEAQSIFTNEFIIISGLHALVPNNFINPNINIFLDTSSDLKKFFKLKRDVLERNHSFERVIESINKRQIDFHKFIEPQASFADISFQLGLRNSEDPVELLKNNAKEPELELIIRTKKYFYFHELLEHLTDDDEIHFSHKISDKGYASEYIFSGNLSRKEVKSLAFKCIPKIDLVLDRDSLWGIDTIGIMQLFILRYMLQDFQD